MPKIKDKFIESAVNNKINSKYTDSLRITNDKKIRIIDFTNMRNESQIDDRLLASNTFFVSVFAYRLHNSAIRDNSSNREAVIEIIEWSARNAILHGK